MCEHNAMKFDVTCSVKRYRNMLLQTGPRSNDIRPFSWNRTNLQNPQNNQNKIK